MEIKVYGPGCASCTATEKLVREVVEEKGGGIAVVKVTDLKDIMTAGVLTPPAVSVDGVMMCAGRTPSKGEVAAWIDGAAAPSPAAPASGGCCCGGRC